MATLKGREIAAVGIWPASSTLKLTVEDLDGIVAAFNALGLSGRVPLKFGHNDEQPITDGQPAIGWVERVYRKGDRLLSDWVDVPEVVARAIQKKLYKFVSVELLKNVRAGNRVIPWVLDAVALLGADQPAIGNLAELSALTASRRRLRTVGGTRVTFKRAFTNLGGKTTMADENNLDTAEVLKQLKTLTDLCTTLKSDNDALKASAKKREEEDEQRAKTEKEEKIKARRKAIKDRFEAAIKATTLLPKHRDSFFATAGVEDDERILKIEDATVDSWLEDHRKSPEKGAPQSGGQGAGSGAVIKAKTWAGEVERRATEKVVAGGHKADDYQQMVKATQAVLREDKDLAQKYFDDPRGSTEADDSED